MWRLSPANERHEVKARRLGAWYCVLTMGDCFLMSPLVFHHGGRGSSMTAAALPETQFSQSAVSLGPRKGLVGQKALLLQ